jgi:predicted ABC-type exoprotein transport system permease subunit
MNESLKEVKNFLKYVKEVWLKSWFFWFLIFCIISIFIKPLIYLLFIILFVLICFLIKEDYERWKKPKKGKTLKFK